MVSYLLKIFTLAIFSFIVIYFYYFVYPNHIENFDGYLFYIIIISIIYGIYKFFQLEFNKDWKAKFSLLKILWLFFLHLIILSGLFFSYNWLSVWLWFNLILDIVFYSFLPIVLVIVSLWFWRKLLKFLPHSKEETDIYRFILSFGLWIFSFISLLAIFWILGFYNFYTVFFILFWFIVYSYKELIEIYKWFLDYKIEFDIEEWSYLKLISTEFLFLISTLVLSVSLISIVRPFPIWWDDLWAYMNIPHLMAQAGTIMETGWMVPWQTFTWIGYLLNSPTQAFFLNNVGWFMSFILIVLIISDLLKVNIKSNNINDKLWFIKTKTFLNIPLLMWTIFISMPMIIFQQAKDMKLDPGLFFISIIVLYLLFKTFRKSYSKNNFFLWFLDKFKKEKNSEDKINNLNYFLDNNDFLSDKKVTYKLIFVIGLLAWFAFAIKLTSLLLLISVIALLFYTKIGFSWFLGFLWIFIALFTKAWLWSYMNISYDKTDISLINTISLVAFLLGIFFIIIWFVRHKENIKKLLALVWIFILGAFIALSPWLWKNIYQAYPNISVWTLLWWKSESFKFEPSKILTKDEIKKIEENKIARIDSDWTVKNEDYGRYFGYEKWINNFVKLPWNLTMQKNQWGEFTNIWFLFLALLPVLFLFLPFRNKFYYFAIVWLLFFELAIFQFGFLSNFLASIDLPFGYLILLFKYLILLVLFIYWLKVEDKENTWKINLFKLNLIFAGLYTFLWSISAYWIVWYGIVMYFSFLLMIAIPLYYLSSYKDDMSEKEFYIKLFWSLVFSLIIVIYIVNSVIPHSFNNLKNAWYKEFKTGQVKTVEAPFLYHSEYLKILFVLNIDNSKREDFLNEFINNDIKKAVSGITKMDIYTIKNILIQLEKENKILAKSAKKSLMNIYKNISNPPKKYRNNLAIYRIWTFLAYHISENNKRLMSDGLLFKFNDYIYNKDIDKTVENFKKLWVWYLLADLNAATIDRDTRRNLTKRYEKLLSTFRSDKLELVETDSICLKLALENWKKSEKTESDYKNYMMIAWVNYESYDKNWKQINRWVKLFACYKNIKNLLEAWKIDKNNYPYLMWLNNYIRSNLDKFKSENDLYAFLQKYVTHGYKVLFKIK